MFAVVTGGLTAVTDGWLLVHLWQDAPAPPRHELPQVTAALLGFTVLTALLGAAVAGRRSTPHRRWRWATLGALLGHLAALGVLIARLLVDPPGILAVLLW
ncbi:hypothetical protein ACIQI7_38800 [Kitasatospora sp. NPDC092039]|uniref:hypothetical protein n=1 Tax=Kitasatospora sp. NPDC092039 TaxID=3364086 RepID=UPI0037F965E4